MADMHVAEPQNLDAPEVMPNMPVWTFAEDVSPDEREQFQGDIVAALKTVFDPEIPCDIYELGLIYKVDIDDSRQAKIEMTLTAPGCPVAGELKESVETAVGAVPGTSGASVDMVFDPAWHQGRMSDEARVALDMF